MNTKPPIREIPVLMITYNRLAFTKIALQALFNCRYVQIYIIDNGSTDGTVEWLKSHPWAFALNITYNEKNLGVAGAMNQYMSMTLLDPIVGKVDNDTIVQPDWCEKMYNHVLFGVDIVQAKHALLKATHPLGFDDWVSTMPKKGNLRFHHFVGGSGIMFRRGIVNKVPETDWLLGGWREWQRQHPECTKVFATDVEVQLLDTNEDGADYSAYPDYYKETKRL